MAKSIIFNLLALGGFISLALSGWNTDNKTVILGAGILIGYALCNLSGLMKPRSRQPLSAEAKPGQSKGCILKIA